MRRENALRLMAVASCATMAYVASAAVFVGPTPYLQFSDSPWSGGSFDYFHMDDIEDHLFNAPGAQLTTGVVTSSVFGLSSAVDSVDEDDGSINGTNGFNGVFGDSLWGAAIDISFSANVLGNLPTHAGLVWTDGPGPSITFEAFDAAGAFLGTLTGSHMDGNFNGGTEEDRFYGVVNMAGVSRIRISSGSAVEADHIQFGYASVPEPTSIVVVGLGIAALTKKRKR